VAKNAVHRNPVERRKGAGYSEHIPHSLTRSQIMNIAKNMEAIFLAAITLISVTSFATASAPQPVSSPAIYAPAESAMQVVTISAKRLTAAEKAAAQ
jgi:hypothetical protein